MFQTNREKFICDKLGIKLKCSYLNSCNDLGERVHKIHIINNLYELGFNTKDIDYINHLTKEDYNKFVIDEFIIDTVFNRKYCMLKDIYNYDANSVKVNVAEFMCTHAKCKVILITRDFCVIPYINGTWHDTEYVLKIADRYLSKLVSRVLVFK